LSAASVHHLTLPLSMHDYCVLSVAAILFRQYALHCSLLNSLTLNSLVLDFLRAEYVAELYINESHCVYSMPKPGIRATLVDFF